ncbi:MAG: 4-hydroxybenzoate octaprenyltransferase [Pseudomonadota bacterium]
MPLLEKLPHFLALMRFEKPIGWLLLLWPTLWALWLASGGNPPAELAWIFVLGVIVMRSAGCVINDYADRDIDHLVERTKTRPLTAGFVSEKEALGLFVLLGLLALCLLLLLPMRVWPWSIPALLLTIIYPFMKRFIQAPQLVLGLAFSFGIPMVFVALDQSFNPTFWLLVICNILWVLLFDTQYAMSDREDDLKIGVKSSAIWFGEKDKLIIGTLQIVVMALLIALGMLNGLAGAYYFGLLLAAGLFAYQQWLIRNRERLPCFQAFLNNGWFGGIVWFGMLLGS